ncbi:MAG: hypothetical protein HN855_04605 [Anaerolineae bacterium]|nr:hypothetical protein [Anaerolineae bacterium]MBT7070376.1 hypothetical protein [Anaerolineae bacterium]MBT7324418.1 hypothetical protein [Anaerolineae bacterium]
MLKSKILLSISILFIFVLACSIGLPAPASPGGGNPSNIATSVAATLQAKGQAPLGGAPSTAPPPQNPTRPPPTIAFTSTPSVPMISVSVDTHCRSGPGQGYESLGALTVGKKAEVVGKRTSHEYWIIKNPDKNGECWLWGYYATVTGDTSGLPEYSIPPVP